MRQGAPRVIALSLLAVLVAVLAAPAPASARSAGRAAVAPTVAVDYRADFPVKASVAKQGLAVAPASRPAKGERLESVTTHDPFAGSNTTAPEPAAVTPKLSTASLGVSVAAAGQYILAENSPPEETALRSITNRIIAGVLPSVPGGVLVAFSF